MQDEYLIPQEIKSETYFGKGVFLFDLVFVFLFYMIMSLFEEAIDERLRIVYTVFNVFIAFILTRKSSKNPGKRVYESLIFSYLHEKDGIQHNIESSKGVVSFEE